MDENPNGITPADQQPQPQIQPDNTGQAGQAVQSVVAKKRFALSGLATGIIVFCILALIAILSVVVFLISSPQPKKLSNVPGSVSVSTVSKTVAREKVNGGIITERGVKLEWAVFKQDTKYILYAVATNNSNEHIYAPEIKATSSTVDFYPILGGAGGVDLPTGAFSALETDADVTTVVESMTITTFSDTNTSQITPTEYKDASLTTSVSKIFPDSTEVKGSASIPPSYKVAHKDDLAYPNFLEVVMRDSSGNLVAASSVAGLAQIKDSNFVDSAIVTNIQPRQWSSVKGIIIY